MSKWVVDIHEDIEGDYEIIKKYEEPKTDVLDNIRAEIETFIKNPNFGDLSTGASAGATKVLEIIDKYKAEREDKE